MIRREMTLPDGEKQWALISQVEHARLAADLARRWRDPLLPDSAGLAERDAARRELLAAVEHHDDGWAEWEESPDIDPKHGRPRSFMEMPEADSLAIWSKSIAVAEQIGPLAAWMVAGHFAALLKVGTAARSEAASLAREWHDLMRSRRAAWLQDWTHAAAGRTGDVAEYALRALQFFDAASLWICCTCPPEGQPAGGDDEDGEASLAFPDGTHFRFTTNGVRSAEDPDQQPASIQPWPLDGEEVKLSVQCHVVPIDWYQATDELLHVSRPHRLTWRLRAGPQA